MSEPLTPGALTLVSLRTEETVWSIQYSFTKGCIVTGYYPFGEDVSPFRRTACLLVLRYTQARGGACLLLRSCDQNYITVRLSRLDGEASTARQQIAARAPCSACRRLSVRPRPSPPLLSGRRPPILPLPSNQFGSSRPSGSVTVRPGRHVGIDGLIPGAAAATAQTP